MYQYPGIFHQGIFLARPNRFIAEVQIHSEVVVCHVKNTGRMTELLVPGRTCYIMEALNPNRKTKYDLIAVEYEDTIVNLDSQVPNKVVDAGVQARAYTCKVGPAYIDFGHEVEILGT